MVRLIRIGHGQCVRGIAHNVVHVGLHLSQKQLLGVNHQEGMLKVLELARTERRAGKQVMIVNMKKNKKFQKEQLAEQGYTDITECYRDSVENL